MYQQNHSVTYAHYLFTNRNAWLQCYIENRNSYEQNGLDNVLYIPYYISSCKTATNFW